MAAYAQRRLPPWVPKRIDGEAEVGVLIARDLCETVKKQSTDEVKARSKLGLESGHRIRDGLVRRDVIKTLRVAEETAVVAARDDAVLLGFDRYLYPCLEGEVNRDPRFY